MFGKSRRAPRATSLEAEGAFALLPEGESGLKVWSQALDGSLRNWKGKERALDGSPSLFFLIIRKGSGFGGQPKERIRTWLAAPCIEHGAGLALR
jgi:hypothetical protein